MEKYEIEFFDVPESHQGAKAKESINQFKTILEGKGAKVDLIERNPNQAKNFTLLKKYLETLVKKKFNPAVPIAVPFTVINKKILFLGYHPKMTERLLQRVRQ